VGKSQDPSLLDYTLYSVRGGESVASSPSIFIFIINGREARRGPQSQTPPNHTHKVGR
jgi:hypothetical protein